MITMNASILPRLQIIVLAAGFSRRLGTPKALARVRGASLLRRTIALLAPLTHGKIIVVIPARASRYRAELRRDTVSIVANLQRSSGLSSSVRAGIARARHSAAALLLPVDMIGLEPRELARLIRRWRSARRRVAARRLHHGQGGTPLILPRWLYPRARAVTGDQGLRELVRSLPDDAVSLVDMPSAAVDVDTRLDLEQARRRGRPPRLKL
jgi:molybdenum cofactor cytidylyltransferase